MLGNTCEVIFDSLFNRCRYSNVFEVRMTLFRGIVSISKENAGNFSLRCNIRWIVVEVVLLYRLRQKLRE